MISKLSTTLILALGGILQASVTTHLQVAFDGTLDGTTYTLGAGETDSTDTFGSHAGASVSGGKGLLGGGGDGFQFDPAAIGNLTGLNWVAETIVSFDSFSGGQLTIIDIQGDTDFRINNTGNALEAGYWDGSTWEGVSTALPAPGTAVHLALAWDAAASALTAYLDGTPIGTVDNGVFATPDTSNVSFGYLGRNGFDNRGIDGQLDAVSFATSGNPIQPIDFLLLPKPSAFSLANGDFETQSGSGEVQEVDGWFESSGVDFHDWVNVDPSNAAQYPSGQGNILNLSTSDGFIYQLLGPRTDADGGLRVSGNAILRHPGDPREFRPFRVSVYETDAGESGADGVHPSELSGAGLLDSKTFTAAELGFSSTPTGPELQPFSVDLSLGGATTGKLLWIVFDAEAGTDETGLDDFAVQALFSDPGPATPPSIEYATEHFIDPSDSEAVKLEKAAKILPEPKQVDWQRLENTFFIHFGPNTFNGAEWGTGFETPADFNPTALDATQWVDVIKRAGGKMLVLVVKHHEGFCLYPSRYTTHDVASSPWLGGTGDVVRAVADACAAEGIKLGIYLSPADLYQIESPFSYTDGSGYYGNGSAVRTSTIPTDPATFGSDPSQGRTPTPGFGSFQYEVDDYNRYFLNQLYELLTEYGDIAEVWFDGANPKQTNPPQSYNEAEWYEMIYALQPDACIAIGGPDVRWVGNETGYARETEWSVIPAPLSSATATDLGSRAQLVAGKTLSWFPAEADTKVLSGWFWKASHAVKTTQQLLDIYHASVGRNANLLLNLSPDTRGLIPDGQIAPLLEAFSVIEQTYATDLAAGGSITADSTLSGQPASNVLDGDLDTWWEPEAGNSTPTVTLTLPSATTFDRIVLQEAIATRSQRIEAFAVDAWNGSGWSEIGSATTVGHKRILLLPETTTDRVRIRITQSRLEPSLANVSLHQGATVVPSPVIGNRDAAGRVAITASGGSAIHFTIDGSDPTPDSPLYTGPVDLPLGGTVRAISHDGNSSSFAVSRLFAGIAPIGWQVHSVDSEEVPAEAAALAIDDDPDTIWHTGYSSGTTPHPHHLAVDMGERRWIRGFTYLPRNDNLAGVVLTYRFEVSANGSDWTEVASGEFDNIRNNPVLQEVAFAAPVETRYFRFTSLSEVNGDPHASAAEINILPGGLDGFLRESGHQTTQPESDPDGDGRPLLLDYYLRLAPGAFAGTAPIRIDPGTIPPSVVVQRRHPVPDVAATLRASHDLMSWFDAPVDALATLDLGNGSARDTYTLGAIAAPLFLRLRVVR
ncbi:discoidin domain-containing protein [Haloferula sp. A504]|uniref:discoidin domain-containing protein n=1 Tax=Haloferula sp. A504 TaxID=3373601 RepID=UPI0031BF263A|nr:alpha-L-fucosidase [Verrucomicrobiaceae bacterium E54]